MEARTAVSRAEVLPARPIVGLVNLRARRSKARRAGAYRQILALARFAFFKLSVWYAATRRSNLKRQVYGTRVVHLLVFH
eukprot:6187591-Pleurochrysis_carterae.AAC.2